MSKSILVLAIFLTACASKQLPVKGELTSSTSSAKMDVSAEVLNDYSDDYNVLLQLNFQSKDGRWIRIDTAELDLSNEDNQPYNIVIGKDLTAWAEAKAEEKSIKDQRERIATSGIALAGGALAVWGALTNNDGLTTLGTATTAGALGYGAYRVIKADKDSVQGVRQVPDTHLYASFTVPSMSLIKRWILINAPTGRMARVATLKLKTLEGDTLTYKIPLVH